MKRHFITAILAATPIFTAGFLFGCGRSQAVPPTESITLQPEEAIPASTQPTAAEPDYPYWEGENEIYSATYAALYSAFGESRTDHNMSKMDLYFPYLFDAQFPTLYFTMNDEDAEIFTEALTPVWAGKDIPPFIINGNLEKACAFLKAQDCASLSLRFVLEEDQALPAALSNVRNLKALDISMRDDDDQFDTANLVPLESVEDLALYGTEVLDESLLEKVPNLKKLTLIKSKWGHPPENVSILEKFPNLTEVCIDHYWPSPDQNFELVRFVYKLQSLDQIEKINGMPKDAFKSGVDEKTEKAALAYFLSAETDAFLLPLCELVAHIKTDQGKIHAGEKILAAEFRGVNISNSINNAILYDKAFLGVPRDRLVISPEEADTAVFFYSVEEETGKIYTNGAVAYRTYTMVATIDLANNNEIATHLIGVTDPPNEIYSGSIGGRVSGEILSKEAEAYIAGLFSS